MLFFLSLISDEESKNKFISIYEKYRILIYKVCIKITADNFLCEDAMQNTFVRIANNIDKIYGIPENEQKVYIAAIAKNCAIDLLNDEKRFFTENLNLHLDFSESKNLQEEYVSNEQYKKLVSYINELDGNYRDVLILSLICELSPKEIAVALNRSLRTVRTQLARGKSIMEKKLKELGIE